MRQLPKRRSITRVLFVSVSLLALTVATLCAYAVAHWESRQARERENSRLTAAARRVADGISLAMQQRRADVQFLRDLMEQEMAHAPSSKKRLVLERAMQADQNFAWVGMVARNGRVQIGTHGLLEGIDLSGRDWYEGARTSAVYFGGGHPAQRLAQHIPNTDGAPLYLLDIAFPLHDSKGQVAGVLGTHLNWKMIENLIRDGLQATVRPQALAASLLDRDGNIIYDSRQATGKFAGLPEWSSQGEVRWPSDHAPSFWALVPVRGSEQLNQLGWRVVVRETASDVNQSVARLTGLVMGVGLGVGLMISLLGLLIVRRSTRHLESLVQEIRTFGETEELVPPREDHDLAEIHELREAFSDMTRKVVSHRVQLQETQQEVIRSLARAGEHRDNETGIHVLRMSHCSMQLALLAGWNHETAQTLRLASQMHDLGKIGVPDEVLLKPGKFDAGERAVMEQHCEIGANILTGLDTPLMRMARTVALHHHEKWDGSGYPHRLHGQAIPQEARIVAICDVFDALLSDRPYKKGWPMGQVVTFMREQSGQHFDPMLLPLFLNNLPLFIAIREGYRDETTGV